MLAARARAGAFNADIKRRVTPSNNSIKLRAGASGAVVSAREVAPSFVHSFVRSFVRSLRADAITFIYVVFSQPGEGKGNRRS